jgi:hypothetical protein
MQRQNNRQLTLPLVRMSLKPDRLLLSGLSFRQTVFRLPRREKNGSSKLGDGEKVTVLLTINISDIFLVLKAYLGQLDIIKVFGYDEFISR